MNKLTSPNEVKLPLWCLISLSPLQNSTTPLPLGDQGTEASWKADSLCLRSSTHHLAQQPRCALQIQWGRCAGAMWMRKYRIANGLATKDQIRKPRHQFSSTVPVACPGLKCVSKDWKNMSIVGVCQDVPLDTFFFNI